MRERSRVQGERGILAERIVMSPRRITRSRYIGIVLVAGSTFATASGCRRTSPSQRAAEVVPRDEDALRRELGRAPGRIAFILADRLHVMNPDGSGHTALVDDQTCADPAWSPDSSRVLYVRRVAAPGPERTEIWSVSADGGRPRLEVEAEWYDAGGGQGQYWEYSCPRMSSDGKSLYFARSRGAISDRQFCEVTPGAGGSPRRVAWGFDFDVHPETQRVASVAFSNVVPWGYGIEVWQAANPGKRRRLVPIAGDEYADVAWSPGGSRIAATYRRRAQGPASVVLIDAATGEVAVRVQRARDPTWSPDGRWLAWLQEDDGAPPKIVAAPADSEGPGVPLLPTPVTPPTEQTATEGPLERAAGRQPAWSPS